jgi:hypothetical protein
LEIGRFFGEFLQIPGRGWIGYLDRTLSAFEIIQTMWRTARAMPGKKAGFLTLSALKTLRPPTESLEIR